METQIITMENISSLSLYPKPGQHICLGLHPVILVPGNGGNQIEASRKKIFKMILLIGGPK